MGKGLAGTALGFAIGGLVLGWFPVLGWLIWMAGLVLAIVAIVKCKTPEDGKGLAIAAIIIVIVSFVFTIIVIGIGAIAYFGVLSPGGFLPNSFTMMGGFSGGEFRLQEDGSLILSFTNNQGMGVNIESFSVESEPTSDVQCSFSEPGGSLPNGQRMAFAIQCAPGQSNEKLKADINIVYTKEGSEIPHTAMGSLITMVG